MDEQKTKKRHAIKRRCAAAAMNQITMLDGKRIGRGEKMVRSIPIGYDVLIKCPQSGRKLYIHTSFLLTLRNTSGRSYIIFYYHCSAQVRYYCHKRE